MGRKKKIEVKKKEELKEEPKAEIPAEVKEDPRIEKFRKMAMEATTLEKRAEYLFWMETCQGKNPVLPDHMR